MTDHVACPICSRQIPEEDINLHLDLQCPGDATTSTPLTTRKASQTSLNLNAKPSPEREVIELADTPPRPTGHGSGSVASGGRSKPPANVASIFGSRKRVKVEDNAEAGPSGTPTRIDQAGGKERKRSIPQGPGIGPGTSKQEPAEKKPRVNPLVANQP
jgi:putative ATPase